MRNFFVLKKTGTILAGFLMLLNLQVLGAEEKSDPLALDFFKKTAVMKGVLKIQTPIIIGHIIGYAFEPPAYTVSSRNLFTVQKHKHKHKYEQKLRPYEVLLQPILASYGDEVRLTPYHSSERYAARGREDLGAAIEYWKDFICAYPIQGSDAQKKKLEREIAYYSAEGELNFDYIEGVIMRFAALFSNPSPDERDVFSHVYPVEYEALLDRESLSSNLLVRTSLEDSSHKHYAKTLDVDHMLSYEGLQSPAIYQAPSLIYKHLHPYMRDPFPCYFTGTKIGIEDMMRLWLSDIYPIGFPAAGDHGGVAHGVQFSLLGFLMHDKFHLDDGYLTKKAALVNFMLKTTDHYVLNQEWELEPFIEAHAPRAAQRYYAVSRVLLTLLDKVKESQESKDVFKPFLAGLFLTTHEKNGFDASIFSGWGASSSVSFIGTHIVRTLAANAREELQSPDAWENPIDLFETSPTTGRSRFNDAQIVSLVIKTHNLSEQDVDPKKARVKRSSRFIDVTIPYKSGIPSFEHSQATLYHKQLNATDSLALFKYAGVRLAIPEGPRTIREEAIQYIDGIHKRLLSLLNTFETVGMSVSNQLDQ